MAEERIVETPTAHTTIIERRGGGSGMLIGIVLLILTMIFTAVQWPTNRSRDLVE